jgi:hypothetical protein
MAILNGRDQLTSKYITAEITDGHDRIHYVPIKINFGDYFLADLDGTLFAFTLKDARILTHYKTLTKSFRVIQYDTSHYASLKPEIKELELMLQKNNMGKLDKTGFKVLSVFAKREKAEFEPHNITELLEIVSKKEGEYPNEIRQIKAYLDELNIEKIVTPVKKITEFIHNDLIATSPSFLGGLIQQYHRVNGEIRQLTNSPVKGSGDILKMAVIGLMAIVIIVGLAYANEQGIFDGITSTVDSFGTIGEGLSGLPSPTQGFQTGGIGADFSDTAIQAKYTPEELQVAVNNGEVDYNKLSSNMKDSVDSGE